MWQLCHNYIEPIVQLNKNLFDALDVYCCGNYASLFPNSFSVSLPGLKMFIRLAKNEVTLDTARSLGVIIAWIAETKLSQHCCTTWEEDENSSQTYIYGLPPSSLARESTVLKTIGPSSSSQTVLGSAIVELLSSIFNIKVVQKCSCHSNWKSSTSHHMVYGSSSASVTSELDRKSHFQRIPEPSSSSASSLQSW